MTTNFADHNNGQSVYSKSANSIQQPSRNILPASNTQLHNDNTFQGLLHTRLQTTSQHAQYSRTSSRSSATTDYIIDLTQSSPTLPDIESAYVSSTAQVSEDTALTTLRKLLSNPEANWTSRGQCQSVMAVLHCQTDVLSVLATGAGKSMAKIGRAHV